ncbi:hypothetical protein [Flavobacterium sp. 102]|uniref:hypothetical protein n=1 Tax=Flavobacterium sp. 102 TaxID=2135623 RepID=UPI000F24C6A9|nr:hypothetical protein [Flavobacterium sp. 102]RKS01686.1 hypothetical protein C8C84_1363 [Flavobacterium sp. 102]
MEANISLKTGTAAGTLLSILPNLHSEDIAKTIILAVLGAVVSFTATLLLKMLTKTNKK